MTNLSGLHLGPNEYIVSAIIGKRKYRGAILYKIKWQGYTDNDSTWEPINNLSKIQDLIKDYESTLPTKTRRKYRTKKKKCNAEEETKSTKLTDNTEEIAIPDPAASPQYSGIIIDEILDMTYHNNVIVRINGSSAEQMLTRQQLSETVNGSSKLIEYKMLNDELRPDDDML